MSIRAADDFETIRKRLEELRKEQVHTDSRTTNLKGETIGQCDLCKIDCVPCQGHCFCD